MKNTLGNMLSPELVAKLRNNGNQDTILKIKEILKRARFIYTIKEPFHYVIRDGQHFILFHPGDDNTGAIIKLFYRKERLYYFDSNNATYDANNNPDVGNELIRLTKSSIPAITVRKEVEQAIKSTADFYKEMRLRVWASLRTTHHGFGR